MEIDGRFRSRMLARDDLRLELLQWIEPAGAGRRRAAADGPPRHDRTCASGSTTSTSWATWPRPPKPAGGTVHAGDPQRAGRHGRRRRARSRRCTCTDPDGTRVEVMSGTPDLGAL